VLFVRVCVCVQASNGSFLSHVAAAILPYRLIRQNTKENKRISYIACSSKRTKRIDCMLVCARNNYSVWVSVSWFDVTGCCVLVVVLGEWISVDLTLIEINIIIIIIIVIESRALGHLEKGRGRGRTQWPLDDRRACEQGREESFISLLGSTAGWDRERGELFFFLFSRLSTLNLPFSLSLSLYVYCPLVNYYTKWTEHKANLILLFRVASLVWRPWLPRQ
jgi:hypothetical protein